MHRSIDRRVERCRIWVHIQAGALLGLHSSVLRRHITSVDRQLGEAADIESRRAIRSVFHARRWTCHDPRINAVTGINARTAIPNFPRFRLVLTSCVGTSTIDTKSGSSAEDRFD